MVKQVIKLIFRSIGWDLHRFDPNFSSSAQTLSAIKHVGVNLVFDIGANAGQFAQDLRSAGFTGTIVSFDPLSEAHQKLGALSRSDRNWLIHPRVALGDQDGETDINISENSFSSSILPMLETHLSAAKHSAYVDIERTPLARLDTLAHQYLANDSCLLVKIDTQGYEWKVLDGAIETLKVARGVLLEMSLVPLYEGQHLWLDLIARMEDFGFTLWALQRGFTDPINGRSLQVDAIFLRV